jgi:pentatricopeptide repeat protein
MYIASGDYQTAEEYFKQIKEPNVQNYVALMNYYNQSQKWEQTLQLYDQMKTQRKIQPDVPTYLAILEAIRETKNLDRAKQVQEDILKQNLWQNHAEIQKVLSEVLETSA